MMGSKHPNRAAQAPLDIPDSGVDCDISSVELSKGLVSQRVPGAPNSWSFVPLELLVTGGKITASIFDRGIMEEGQKQCVKVGQDH